jgi:hypothetical protein
VLNEDQRVVPVCVDGNESRYYHFDHEEGRPFVYVQEYRPRQVKADPGRGTFFLACRDTLSLAKVVGLLRKGNRRDQQAAAVLTDLLAVYKDAETRQVTKDKAAEKEVQPPSPPPSLTPHPLSPLLRICLVRARDAHRVHCRANVMYDPLRRGGWRPRASAPVGCKYSRKNASRRSHTPRIAPAHSFCHHTMPPPLNQESWHAQSDRQGRLTELHASATRYVEHATRYLAAVGGAKEDAVVA